ncbi:MAG: YkgJ family cysteine cluster protein [Desulfosarcinaceae bacterium]|nr:YkgJ family cysteine cluster protein [Desulfosarcinaceae bacterium]
MSRNGPDEAALNTIFHACRQCGACCRTYRKIRLRPEEAPFIRKMGGHVGVDLTLAQLREQSLAQLKADAQTAGHIFMVHPDDKGCVFLEKRNGHHRCKIYHYRPQTCRGFRCNMADSSFLDIFSKDANLLLGLDSFGLPLKRQ